MALSPNFVGTPRIDSCQISAANTNLDGATGAYGDCFTAAAGGSRVHKITVQSGALSNSLGMVRVFVKNGATWTRLWKEIPISAATASGTAQRFFRELFDQSGQGLPLLILPSGFSLRFSTQIGEVFNCFVEGGDF